MDTYQPASQTDFRLISLPFKQLWVFRADKTVLKHMGNESFNISVQVESGSKTVFFFSNTIVYPHRGGAKTSAIKLQPLRSSEGFLMVPVKLSKLEGPRGWF